ncbi:hypothetical protein [Amycolatopsis pithecellobii]|uniref:Uncharacterized protein n=1 Tax=Amycolatopsis pithecellobii TaxID=664692 RepID=A0A6N7YUW8_9PSEU|nr:hypothetical protein [Amycolatopsis pithecellobii]MTD56867.1 hypothetical protein [Amycolatopsis pithecellobii]
MWDYATLYGKASLYFNRAQSHPRFDDDEFGIWALLGLEFLLRTPLAKVHPSLLAAPDGNSILHSVGILIDGDLKSIPTHTVISRLPHIVPDFDSGRVRDATVLMNLRNSELHTGEAAIANAPISLWLPRFLRVSEVVCSFLEIDVESLLGESVVAHARSLVDEQDKKTQHEVGKKLNQASTFFENLQKPEIDARRDALPKFVLDGRFVECPTCESQAILRTEYVRTSGERIEDDIIYTDRILVAKSFECSVCGLQLEDTRETATAGLPQQFVETTEESLDERYAEAVVDWDYGND